jgi:hypothetical protein
MNLGDVFQIVTLFEENNQIRGFRVVTAYQLYDMWQNGELIGMSLADGAIMTNRDTEASWRWDSRTQRWNPIIED